MQDKLDPTDLAILMRLQRDSSASVGEIAESVGLSLLGGMVGLMLASGMQWVEFSTTNFQSFSELAFGFELSLGIAIGSLGFAVAMGIAGGLMPAIRASRIGIVEALRCG